MRKMKQKRNLRAVIVDDDPMMHYLLDMVCKQKMDFIDLIGGAFGVEEGQRLIKKKKPDLVFTDIEMPDGTGFDLVDSFPNDSFAYVMLSSETAYAERASKTDALSFFPKPVCTKSLSHCLTGFYASFS